MKLRLTPSELRTYFYCPRLYFFEQHVKRRRGLAAELRLLLGSLAHLASSIIARLFGRRAEEEVEAELGQYLLRGRIDQLELSGRSAKITELKTSSAPSQGAWTSDYMQALAYALMLSMTRGVEDVKIEIRYRNGRAELEPRSEHVAHLLRAVEEAALVKYYGILPFANRSRKCASCRYREECEELGDDELGSWIAELPPVVRPLVISDTHER